MRLRRGLSTYKDRSYGVAARCEGQGRGEVRFKHFAAEGIVRARSHPRRAAAPFAALPLQRWSHSEVRTVTLMASTSSTPRLQVPISSCNGNSCTCALPARYPILDDRKHGRRRTVAPSPAIRTTAQRDVPASVQSKTLYVLYPFRKAAYIRMHEHGHWRLMTSSGHYSILEPCVPSRLRVHHPKTLNAWRCTHVAGRLMVDASGRWGGQRKEQSRAEDMPRASMNWRNFSL